MRVGLGFMLCWLSFSCPVLLLRPPKDSLYLQKVFPKLLSGQNDLMRRFAPQLSDGWRHWREFREDDGVKRCSWHSHSSAIHASLHPQILESDKSTEVTKLPEQIWETLERWIKPVSLCMDQRF